MDPETARITHYAILAGGVLVWLAALWFHRRAFRTVDPLHPDVLAEGEIEVPAPRGTVRDRLVQSLRVRPGELGGSFLIERADDRRVSGRASVFPTTTSPRRAGFEVDLADVGSGTRATWRVTKGAGSGLRRASALFVYFLSPAVLAAAAVVMAAFVLPSDDPSVRAQSIQTIQVIHFLWPPFLLASLGRRIDRLVGTWLETALQNAAF